MAKDTPAAPSLPPASVDFNKLHQECKAGRKPETALKNAVIGETVAEPAGAEAEEGPAIIADTSADQPNVADAG